MKNGIRWCISIHGTLGRYCDVNGSHWDVDGAIRVDLTDQSVVDGLWMVEDVDNPEIAPDEQMTQE